MDVVVSNLALIRRRDGEFVLEEVAPGFSADEVLGLTDMALKVSPELSVMGG